MEYVNSKTSGILKLIKNRLCDYELIKQAVADCRADSNCLNKTGGGGIAYKSDPTANKAVKNLTPINKVVIIKNGKSITVRQPEKWLKLAEGVFEHFNDMQTRRIIVYRFLQEKDYKFICSKMKLSKGKYYKQIDIILWFAMSYACQLGLVKIK